MGIAAMVWSCAVLSGCGDRGEHANAGGPIDVRVSFGEVGLSPGQFQYPRCLDSGMGALWAIDKSARVQKLDPKTGASLGGWRMPEWEFGKPTGVTVAPGDGGEMLVYVPDTHYHRVMIYRAKMGSGGGESARRADVPGDGELVTSFGSFGTEGGKFTFVTDVAVLMSADGTQVERLYVSEYGGNDRVSVFVPGGAPNTYRYSFAFGRFGSSADAATVEFSRPQSLAIDRERRWVVVTDACNHRVGVFTLDGGLVRWIGSADEPTDALGRFKFPYGLALLGDGTAMVAEFGGNRLQHVDLETGRGLGVYGEAGRGPGQLASPWGVTVLGDTVYALDSGNNRIVGFAVPKKLAASGRTAGRIGGGS